MIQIAILGFGVVGAGVADVLTQNAVSIAQRTACEISVKYILDVRNFPDSPYADKLISDFETIINDPEIQIVAEAIGGAGAAYDFTKRCLLAGKSVVTSNKELVATHGTELLAIAKEKNVNYLFEASVGGGIPIIRPLAQCLAANEISEVCGILNGTTNYILSKMEQTGSAFAETLKEAQAKGYAEADPTADIEGDDSCRKICILASLAFGEHVPPAGVSTVGITQITQQDIDYAKRAGYKIKLLGRARRLADGRTAAYVAPHLIAKSELLANVDDVFNAVIVRGNAVGDVLFYGPGAGALPTASAVVADVIDCAKHLDSRKQISWQPGDPNRSLDPDTLQSRWYIRAPKGTEAGFDSIEMLSDDSMDGAVFLTTFLSQARLVATLKATTATCAFRLLEA